MDGQNGIGAATEIEPAEGARDREYEITVRATEKTTSGDDHRALSTETPVTVVVDDVNESGTVTLNRLQPEVGTAIMASLSDPDDGIDITGGFDDDSDPNTTRNFPRLDMGTSRRSPILSLALKTIG